MGLVDTGTPKSLMLGKKRSMASGAAEYSRKNMSDLPLLSSHLCRVDEEGNTLRHALMRFFSRPREPGQPFSLLCWGGVWLILSDVLKPSRIYWMKLNDVFQYNGGSLDAFRCQGRLPWLS